MKLLLTLLLLLQSVKMTEDFLPLQAGNRWVYDVTSENGQKAGQLEFSINDRTIASGRSLYVVSGYPFAGSTSDPIRLIGYDRDGRQFVRIAGDQLLPLFPGDAESAEVLQSDASGVPQKFSLQNGTSTLVFQRGVGIVEARFQSADGLRIAKLASSSIGVSAVASTAARPASTAAPPATPAVPNVAPVTAENPVLVVSSEAVSEGLKLELMVANTKDKLLPFRFNSSKSYDFVITDPASGKEVWRWSHGMLFGQMIRSDSIRASGKWTFTEVWNRRDNDKNPVPPGRYILTGILTAQPEIQSRAITIEVP